MQDRQARDNRTTEAGLTIDDNTPQPPPSLRRVVIRGTGLAGGGYFLTNLITLGFYVVVARLAPPVVFGTFAAAGIAIGLGNLFSESGMTAALLHRRDRLEEAAATAVFSTLLGGLGLSLLALALAPLIGLYFHSYEIGIVAAAISGMPLFHAARVVPDALLQRRFSFLRKVVIDPMTAVAAGVTSTITLAQGLGVWGLVLSNYVAGVVSVSCSWLFCNWKPDLRKASFAMWRELAAYAKHVVGGELLREVNLGVNTALIGRFLSASALGQFRFAWRISTMAAAPFVSASAYVLLPAFSRVATDEVRFRAASLRSLRALALAVLPLSLFFFPFGEQIAVAVFGEPWRSAGQALTGLCGAAAAMPLLSMSSSIFKAAGRPDMLPRIGALQSVALIVLVVALLRFGIVGVAAGVSLAYLIALAYTLPALARVLAVPMRVLLTHIAAPIGAAVGMTLALYAVQRYAFDVDQGGSLERLGLLAIMAGVGASLYLTLLAAIEPRAAAEVAGAVRAIGGRVGRRPFLLR
jgi:PST family polysaccharide transporter